MVACPNCGKENTEGSKHCGFCGSKIQVRATKSTMFGMAAVDPAELERVRKAFEAQTSTALKEAHAQTSAPPTKTAPAPVEHSKPAAAFSAGVQALSRPTRKPLEKPKDLPLSISGSAPALARPQKTPTPTAAAPVGLSNLLSEDKGWGLDQGWDTPVSTELPILSNSTPVSKAPPEDMGFAETIDTQRDAMQQAIANAASEEDTSAGPSKPRGTLLGMNIHDELAAAKAKALADAAKDGSLGVIAPAQDTPTPEQPAPALAASGETPNTAAEAKGTLLGFSQVQPNQAAQPASGNLPAQQKGPKTVPVGSVADASLSGPVPALTEPAASEPALGLGSGAQRDSLDFPGPGAFESSYDHDEEAPKSKLGLILGAVVVVLLLLAVAAFFIL